MPIVKDGCFEVPLFHGTSSLFLDRIRATGLGGEDPHIELGTREFLSELFELSIDRLKDDAEFQGEEYVIRKMVSQEVTRARFNFRHGSSYLTPSRDSAVRYALSNRYGSELLTTTFWLYELLRRRHVSEVNEMGERYGVLVSHLGKEVRPILVEAQSVMVTELRAETGEDPTKTVSDMETFSELATDMWQQLNFELIIPINADRLTCYQISGTMDDGIFPDFRVNEI